MRCPHCQGLSAKRNGKTRATPQGLAGPGRPLQRFICNDCRKTFTSGRTVARPDARFTVEVVREAVRRYVQGLTSYLALAQMLSPQLDVSVSRFTLNSWVDEAGGQAPAALEVSARLQPPGWGGILGVDGKAIWVDGVQRCLLLGVDQTTQDIVHRLVLDGENAEEFRQLIHEAVVVAGYPLRGLVIDGGPGWVEVWENYFSKVPLQLCRIHFDRRLDQEIPKLERSPRAPIAPLLHAPRADEAGQPVGREPSYAWTSRSFLLQGTPSRVRRRGDEGRRLSTGCFSTDVDSGARSDIVPVISEVSAVPDVLVRDVDPATLARIDAVARRAGVSRNVLLRELLTRYADEQESGALTDEQIDAFGSSVRDLLDDEARAAAWRR